MTVVSVRKSVQKSPVHPTGEKGCEVERKAEFHSLPEAEPQMKQMMEDVFAQGIEGLESLASASG